MHAWDALDRYARHDPRWFESSSHYQPTTEYLAICQEILPKSWRIRRSGIWFIAEPPDSELPEQGWKIHLSVSSRNAEDFFRQALDVLRDESIAFKFVLDRALHSSVNGKLWPRQASGKFIAAYPESIDQFKNVGQALADQLASFSGPYVLSDRRWPGSKCVFYRYGGIRNRSLLRVDGLRTQVITGPDGDLVKDLRLPYWNPPAWAVDPIQQEELPGNSPPGILGNGRFAVKSALQFTNRGGVYLSHDNSSGQDVVIKEARPGVEIGSQGIDAISLNARQFRLLQRLAETGFYVQPIVLFTEWEHSFLVEEFVSGEHLGRFTIRRNPLYKQHFDAMEFTQYLETIREIWIQLAQAIGAAHKRNIVLGDLSFGNVIVGNDLRITIIDLEAAAEEEVDHAVGLTTPGFSNPRASPLGASAQADDYYALGALIFGSAMLANGIISIHPPARHRFLSSLTTDLALPAELVALIDDLLGTSLPDAPTSDDVAHRIRTIPIAIGRGSSPTPRIALSLSKQLPDDLRHALRDQAASVVEGVTRYITATADPERSDRLFPADPQVYESNPLSVAYGAAGVLYAMKRMGGEVPDAFLRWMLRCPVENDDVPPGLYIGQAGIAWVLAELGQLDNALHIMRMARFHPLLFDSANVQHGAAGYGLACLRFWTLQAGEEFLDEAIRIGDWLVGSSAEEDQGIWWPDRQDGKRSLGYALGGSGVALFLLYLHLATGVPKYLSSGQMALRFDLAHARWADGKFVGFPPEIAEGTVPSPYWQVGTTGVATTLLRYLVAGLEPELEWWQGILEPDISRKYVAFPQLFRGLSGLGNYLIDAWEFTGTDRYYDAAWRALEGVLLARMERPEGIAFPGEQALRECADFATGASGVGLFISRLIDATGEARSNFNFVVDELLPRSHGASAFVH